MSAFEPESSLEVMGEVPGLPAVDVMVRNVVRTDEMPCEVGYGHARLLTGAHAVKLLPADPRRKVAYVWIAATFGTGAEAVCLASSMGQAEQWSGALVFRDTVHVRHPIHSRREVWARPLVVNDTAGTISGYAVSTDDMIVSWLIEQWTD